MKRIVIIITAAIAAVLILIIVSSLLACDIQPNTVVEQERFNETSIFVEVEHTYDWTVVYHRQTKVMYVFSNAHSGDGAARVNSCFTVMLDADGMPLLWKGE